MDNSLKNRVISILEEEQAELKGCLDPQTDVVAPTTLEQVKVSKNKKGQWSKSTIQVESNLYDEGLIATKKKEQIDKAETLRLFCKESDDKILSFNGQINSIKQQIVTLSAEAITGNCWPGIACSVTFTVPNCGVTSFYGENVQINNDIENIKIYPKMAGPEVDLDAQNVFEPDTIYTLTPAYSGYGYKNLVDKNFYYNKDGSKTGSKIDGSGTSLGIGRFDISKTLADHSSRLITINRIYQGAGVSPPATQSITAARCVQIANEIESLYNDIIDLRKQRDTFRSDLNTIKDNKKEKELAAWGLNRVERRIDVRETKNVSAIAAVNRFESDNPNELILHIDAGDVNSYSGIGTALSDLSGTGNNVTLFPLLSPAAYEYSNGGFITFNGTDEYADSDIKATDILDTGEWTIEVWFRVNGAPSDVNYTNVIVDTNPTSATANMLSVTYGQTAPFVGIATNVLAYSSRTSIGLYSHLVSTEVIKTGYWYHGVVVRNSTESTRLYVNGSLNASFSGSIATESDSFVRIARWTDETVYSNISISVLKIYKRAFSDGEIGEKYNSTKSRYSLLG